MDEVGLFPLGMALLPGEQVPLHIFEPRYRELIGECLERDVAFGFILQDAGQLRAIGTRARIDEVLARFDDGRLNVMVAGERRFRVVAMTSGRSFLTAQTSPVVDEPDPPSPEELDACLAAYHRLASGRHAEAPEPLDASEVTAEVSFAIAGRLGLPAALKQELLELNSERQRVLRLTEELEGPVAEALAASEISRRASTNGHVDR